MIFEKSAMELYLGELKNCPSNLKINDERELLKRAAAGDKKAREKIIKANLRFVVSVAKRFWKRGGVSLEDLICAGNLALYESFDTFDFEKFCKNGCGRFITYAGRRICQRIEQESRFALSVSMGEGAFKDFQKNAKSAWQSAKSKRSVALLLAGKGAEELDSAAKKISSLENVSESVQKKIDSELILLKTKRLPELERKVVFLVYGLSGGEPLNYPAVGKRIGYTREGVRAIHNRAVKHLKEMLGA